MRTLAELKELIACGKGETACDWKLENVQLVNVYSREIYPTDIYIKGKRIVSIEPGIHLEARQVKDCGGKDWKPDEDEEDPDMDILKQCQKWHENNEYHKIIEALEGIEERTPEMDSQLARAYNNEADHRTPEGRAMLLSLIHIFRVREIVCEI